MWANTPTPLLVLTTIATSALAANADVVTFPANIEVDIIFPRNDTYAQSDAFPIVFALQGATPAWLFGFQLSWTLNYADGYASNGLTSFGDIWIIDEGTLPPSDPYIFVNTTAALPPVSGNHSYTLGWEFSFATNCTDHGDTFEIESVPYNAKGGLVFTLAKGAKQPDMGAIAASGACPVLGGVVGLQSNLTGCPHLGDTGKSANPCAVTVDAALASSVMAQIASTTTASTRATGTAGSGTGTTTSSGSGSTATGKAGGNAAGRAGVSLAAVIGAAALIL